MQSTTAKRFCATIAVSSRSANFYSTTASTINTAFEPSSPPPPRHLTRLPNDAVPSSSTTNGNSSGSSNGNAQGQSAPLPSLLSVSNSQVNPPGSSPTDRSGSSLNNNNSSKFNPSAVPPATWSTAALHAASTSNTDTTASAKGKERETRQVYTLDVGAYGIPKRGRGWSTIDAPEFDALDLAVQVGEDAYFVRDDAMGVADGVGGWSSRHSTSSYANRRPGPSPSALFARRLMHFCALELKEVNVRRTKNAMLAAAERQQRAATSAAGSSTRLPSLRSPLLPRSSTTTAASSQQALKARKGNARPFLWPWERDYRAGQQHDHQQYSSTNFAASETESEFFLGMGDELIGIGARDPTSSNFGDKKVRDEIDPVEILESAYRRTISAHRVRASTFSSPSTSSCSSPERPSSPSPSPSSTRLRASLSPSKLTPSKKNLEIDQDGTVPLREGSSTALVAVLAGSTLRIAHLGDCAAFLVRAGEVIWRSEEMWWAFNHPLQLGPRSPATPRTHARSYDVPVQEGDIVILCSDGMSDNLWEEDVMEEVRRFGGVWDLGSSASGTTGKGERENGFERRVGASAKKTSEVLAEENDLGGGLPTPPPSPPLRPSQTSAQTLLGRRTFAGMLSEALCSRARKVSECARVHGHVAGDGTSKNSTKISCSTMISSLTAAPESNLRGGGVTSTFSLTATKPANSALSKQASPSLEARGSAATTPATQQNHEHSSSATGTSVNTDPTDSEVPFARRAREGGRTFHGGKCDDISVVVAVISPAETPAETSA